MDKNEKGYWNRKTVSDARSLLKGIMDFQFIATLIITKNIMSYSKILSVALQGTSIDIVKAFRMINLVKTTLQDARDKITEFNNKWYNEAVILAEGVGIEPAVPRTASRMLHRGNIPALSASEFYKRNVAIPLLDHLTVELDSRFNNETECATKVLHLVPSVIRAAGKLESETVTDFIDI